MCCAGTGITRGLSVHGDSRIDFHLTGDWQTFQADAGIEDGVDPGLEVRFQVHGDGRLLYDSGPIGRSIVVKPQIDIRGVTSLSLRTIGALATTRANWANARVTGFAGDFVRPEP